MKAIKTERLDDYSKILIATNAINYMANNIDRVNSQMKTVKLDINTIKEGIKQRDEALSVAVESLGQIMENLGNIMNDHDISGAIDEKITAPAFDIIIHGKDTIQD